MWAHFSILVLTLCLFEDPVSTCSHLLTGWGLGLQDTQNLAHLGPSKFQDQKMPCERSNGELGGGQGWPAKTGSPTSGREQQRGCCFRPSERGLHKRGHGLIQESILLWIMDGKGSMWEGKTSQKTVAIWCLAGHGIALVMGLCCIQSEVIKLWWYYRNWGWWTACSWKPGLLKDTRMEQGRE